VTWLGSARRSVIGEAVIGEAVIGEAAPRQSTQG
jgi:hypothetical protein